MRPLLVPRAGRLGLPAMTALRCALGCALLATLFASCAAAPPRGQPLSAADWRADLQYLERELLERNPAPFRWSDEGSFRRGLARLSAEADTATPAHMKLGIARLVASLRDGHTLVFLGPTHFPAVPLEFRRFEDVRLMAALPEHRRLLGGRLLAVGGVRAESVLAAVSRLVSADNELGIQALSTGFLARPALLRELGFASSPDRASYRIVTLTGDTATLEVAVPAPGDSMPLLGLLEATGVTPPLAGRRPLEPQWFDSLPERHTLYMRIDRSQDVPGRAPLHGFIESALRAADAPEVDRVVVDLRNNFGGNFHLTEPLVAGLAKRERFHRPRSVVVLTGRGTFSAAAVLVAQLKRDVGAVLVGEPTRARVNFTYDCKLVSLPRSGLKFQYTSKLHRPWPEIGDAAETPVDVPVATTFEDVRSARDPVLDAALALER